MKTIPAKTWIRWTAFLALALAALPLVQRLREKRYNVLLVTFDTTRADHLPPYGYGGIQTPTLDGLAHDGVLFKRARSHVPLTLPSHSCILTGLYPMGHGLRNNGGFYAPPNVPFMAKVFKKHGYRTAAFVGAFVLDSRFGADQGFDVYDDDMADGRVKRNKFGFKDRRAGMVGGRFLAWFKKSQDDPKEKSKPFFSWVHFYDPHEDYDPPEPFRSQYPNDPYGGEIAYADHVLGVLIQTLKDAGLYDKTLIIMTSDHGENMGEHGEKTHSVFIYSATQWIPLILKLPGQEKAGTSVSDLVRHVDIYPTIMELLHFPGRQRGDPPRPGLSLLPLIYGHGPGPERPCYFESYLPLYHFGWSPLEGVELGDGKYIRAPKSEYYDLAKDPHELNNLLEQEKGKAASLSRLLEKIDKDYTVAGADRAASTKDDPETMSKLEGLGYMAGGTSPQSGDLRDPKDLVQYQEMLQTAHSLISQDQKRQAIPILLRLLEGDPKNVVAMTSLAGVYKDLRGYKQALELYDRAQKTDPTFMQAYTGKAFIYIKNIPDFEKAAKELDAAAALTPNETSITILRADLLLAQNKLDEALAKYKEAEAQGEQAPNLFVGMGSALNRQGKFAEAIPVLKKALAMNPETPEALYNLGVVFENLGRYAESEQAYKQAIALNAEDGLSYGNLGSLYHKQRRMDESLAAINRAIKLNPNDVISLYNKGTVLLDLNRPAEAQAPLEKAMALDPDLGLAYTNLATAQLRLKQPAKAYDIWKRLTERPKAEPRMRAGAFLNMARMRTRQGDKAQAQALIQQAIELGGDGVRQAIAKDPILGAGGRVPTGGKNS